MRTIKFRAKCLDNGEWVYGGSSLIADDFCVIQKGTEFYCETRVYSRTERFFQLQGFVCDKNTLGQFTGVFDKNGTEVYEGDLVRIAETENHVEIIAVVRFDEGKFTANSIKSSVSFSLDYVFRERQPGCLLGEVIGNIYDKPHLQEKSAIGYEWYDQNKHKDILQQFIKRSLITGYEMDITPHHMNDGYLMYVVNGNPNIHITKKDFDALCEEVREMS